ncbi:unnamed protein product [Caenorhabditis auriculariae]|uniref:EGF-like domain-containing protein n=1 Tax=Caenorhabditis auriculariae TaxID=2777116 RepID=A0A8S1HJW6_9PELO|nr:unnamed protein product [Caenorhabditis auriculariae]
MKKFSSSCGCGYYCSKTSNRCRHGGYPTPRDCSVCLCPDGFGGRFCNEPEPSSVGQRDNYDCGGILWATEETQTFFGAVRTRVGPQSFLATPEYCWWHIRVSYSFYL